MKVPFNDLKRQYDAFATSIEEALLRVGRSGWYLTGKETETFERAFAQYCGVPGMAAVGNGTDALELALRCAGCGPGSEVITAANAGGYATTAAVLVGATPVFADVDPVTLTISPDSVAALLSNKTRVVVVTHLFGQFADVRGIQSVIGGRDTVLIEDCAQSHGAVYDGKRAGSYGDLATFSFYPTKNLGALGDAGAVGVNRAEWLPRLQALRQYGWESRYHAAVPRGRNSRMDELQAAVLSVKLPHLDAWNQRRREIASRYRAAAQGTPLQVLHGEDPSNVGHLCVALHPDREAFRARLRDRGVDTAIHYPNLDPQQPAIQAVPHRVGALTVASQVQPQILSLPCFPELSDLEVTHVCEAIQACA